MFGRDNVTGEGRQIELDGFTGSQPILTTDHAKIHQGEAWSLSGSMDVATTKTGMIRLRTGSTKATTTIDMTNATADLTYTAATAGRAGNSITVTHVDPEGNDQELAVSVSGTDITVSLATDGAGTITSTAAQVKAAVNASAAAAALVTCEDEGTGTGVVNAAEAATLTGGTDACYCHFKPALINTSTGPMTVVLLEDSSFVGGSALEAKNRKRSAAVAPVSNMVVYGLNDATAVDGSAVDTLETHKLFGSAVGATKLGSSTNAAEEWLLKPGTNYLIKFVNDTTGGGAATVNVAYDLYWYEETVG